MRDCKDWDWNIQADSAGKYIWPQIHAALLMDIREELRAMNLKLNVLQCGNFLKIPRVLESIKRNTNRKKKPTNKRSKRS